MNEKIINIVIPAVVLVCGILVGMIISQQSFFENKLSFLNKNILSLEEAGQMALNYIDQNILKDSDLTASLIEEPVVKNGVYELKLKIGDSEFTSYLTKDGELLFPEAIDLEEGSIVQESESQTSPSSPESTISPEELTKFIDCLKKADFTIYGANWCGWTEKLVEMLGGWDMVEPIYVECTEEEELCEEKGVRGYPTILINDEQYQGDRTFEEFAAATGCQLPPGAEFISEEESGGGDYQ